VAPPRGFDGAKKVNGVKPHILVGTSAVLVAAVVTPERPSPAAANAGVSIDTVSGPEPANGVTVQPRRWVVERTNG
jgi:hypothetical protein